MASGLPVFAVEASGTSDVVTQDKEGFLTACDHKALGGHSYFIWSPTGNSARALANRNASTLANTAWNRSLPV